jgi:hypothetical protein
MLQRIYLPKTLLASKNIKILHFALELGI